MSKEKTDQKKRGTARWIWEFAGAKKGEYIISVITALIGVACQIAPYVIMIELIQNIVANTATKQWCMRECILMGIWWVARYVFHSISTTLSHHATFTVLGNIRLRLLDKLSTLPLGTVLEQSSGSYKNTIVERVDSIETTLAHIVPEFTSNICGAIAVFVMMFLLDWRLALSMLIVLPIGLLCFMTMFSGYGASFQRTVDSTKALNDTAVEYINGIEVIKSFGQSKTSYAKFVDAAKEGADCFIDWMQRCIFGQSAGMAIFPATLLGLLPIGCILTMNGTLNATVFISAIVLSFGVMQPLITVFSYTDDLAQISVVMNDVTSILEKEDLHRADTADKQPANNTVTVENIHFSYNDKEVLHGVSFELKPGSVNALVGPSGSGKSTIAKLIASLWDVQSGSIKIGGVDIRELPLNECTKRIAYVSQENYLFNQSVMDNIRMGKQGASDEEVMTAAKACGCHEFIMKLENGYQTICGSSGGHLSGGERQRISIARAMLKGAPIIILDEATSYTDPENEAVMTREKLLMM
ncbi:MAG: ABC transporter ATP-binding protein [Eubacteriales bacterium]|nr:ABC transporter ATP-binding protein [Eubacteriales bacterium]